MKNVKKIVAVLVVVALALSVVACSRKPAGMSQEMYDSATIFVKVTEDYLAGRVQADQAYTRLNTEWDTLNAKTIANPTLKDAVVSTYLFSIYLQFGNEVYLGGTIDKSELKSTLDQLKKTIR
ncbi:MAG: hypothetical protein FWD43_03015 [Coriobacteriia bacterium]|nr:hypothetical protein [Coriobacteriia bacterium]